MKVTAIEIEERVDALLVCLNKDVQRLEEVLLQLDELRGLVIKRDDIALGKLLESIQRQAEAHRQHELNRQATRRQLATALGYDERQVTLSALETILPNATKDRILDVKAKIRSLMDRLRKEHLSTALLLSECARFNNLLLRGIFNLSKKECFSYGSNGTAKRQSDIALINLQL
jgi:hypothetical protein